MDALSKLATAKLHNYRFMIKFFRADDIFKCSREYHTERVFTLHITIYAEKGDWEIYYL